VALVEHLRYLERLFCNLLLKNRRLLSSHMLTLESSLL
jgi:hypothetical protein